MNIKDFEILFVDKSDFEYLVAQIRFKNFVLCEINRERGVDSFELDIVCNDEMYNGQKIKFALDDFLMALDLARKELYQM